MSHQGSTDEVVATTCARPGEMLSPETIVALRALADAARREVKREQTAASRAAEHRRKKERRRMALSHRIRRRKSYR